MAKKPAWPIDMRPAVPATSVSDTPRIAKIATIVATRSTYALATSGSTTNAKAAIATICQRFNATGRPRPKNVPVNGSVKPALGEPNSPPGRSHSTSTSTPNAIMPRVEPPNQVTP